MSDGRMSGVFPILVTPFDEQSRLDEESLRRLVEFTIAAGVHGLGLALGSEIYKLSEQERATLTRIVVDQARRRVPVVVNTGGAATDLAVLYSRTAEEQGADALMVLPPTFAPASAEETRDYFRAVSAAVTVPIFLQDTGGAPISGALARQLADECEHVRYIKVESAPAPLKVAEAVRQAGDRLTVFGGAGGNYLLEELRRGSRGTMPGCSQPEAFVETWNLYQAGDLPAARAVFERQIVPVNRLAGLGWGAFYTVHKELLRRRGVIRTATVRRPTGGSLDAPGWQELQDTIDRLGTGGWPAAESGDVIGAKDATNSERSR
jgi:dihydrodipicolinate synthase/N-acetylneuraminate lyase